MTSPTALRPTAEATKEDFAHVRDWVFDLDNTLYPRHSNLFSQIDLRMTDFVAEFLALPKDKAREVQKDFYRRYGTTLRGLMSEHNVDPDAFLNFVHDIDYSWIDPDPALGDEIKALPGRKFIFTNGDRNHAERAARQLGILDHFEDIFDLVAADLVPKPASETYDKFLGLHRVDAAHAAMFEDLARNLQVPKSLGMKTVLIVPQNFETTFGDAWEHEGREGEHIDFVTDDLASFIRRIRS
ncbi:putative hydrolase of the HAD superfamily [Fulvimarina manganoxydans]|uniref:Putative hydrolase of the HAD superfamily n=1 Tax=Fulvimarina manganoxydans TaxID=937218 RepID=A0A1W2E535_9HYPH|nr:pyrimidine 5'-nucleotidase [Fulvimarina manganoxydans]MCK5932091.1 pyrimidine 5'-nucleotidase [Fulvimarina manganoxydans]MEE2952953.1 pyrimidine 5'-nucleotidase [Pseudomonadota bacterium]SMD04889.1 putative hydrolase of the HAD superfamily [Fulvimarina manganoxydans]